jgi:hypothetical protein
LSAPRRFGLSGSLPLHRTARRADRSLRRRPWYPVYMRFPACIADLGSPVTSGVGSPLFQQRLLSGRSIRFSRRLNLYGNFVLNHQGARYGLSDCPRYSVAVERADSSRVIIGLIVRGLPFIDERCRPVEFEPTISREASRLAAPASFWRLAVIFGRLGFNAK